MPTSRDRLGNVKVIELLIKNSLNLRVVWGPQIEAMSPEGYLWPESRLRENSLWLSVFT